jgi:hypothetical protein
MHAGTSLVTGLALSHLSLSAFWLKYAALGGNHTLDELRAYLGGRLEWTSSEHDTAAHALNEYCTAKGMGTPVAYADEV